MTQRRTKGGATPYRKGAAFENKVLRFLTEQGHFGLRSPTSASPIDLMVVGWVFVPGIAPRPYHQRRVYFIQVKLGGYIRPADKKEVIDLAARYGGIPVLAKPGEESGSITFIDLRSGGTLDEELGSLAAYPRGSQEADTG